MTGVSVRSVRASDRGYSKVGKGDTGDTVSNVHPDGFPT